MNKRSKKIKRTISINRDFTDLRGIFTVRLEVDRKQIKYEKIIQQDDDTYGMDVTGFQMWNKTLWVLVLLSDANKHEQ